jgi:hypothetical protein
LPNEIEAPISALINGEMEPEAGANASLKIMSLGLFFAYNSSVEITREEITDALTTLGVGIEKITEVLRSVELSMINGILLIIDLVDDLLSEVRD